MNDAAITPGQHQQWQRYAMALVLLLVNGALQITLNASSIFGNGNEEAIGEVLGYVLVGPMLLASLYCIPKKNRNLSAFLRALNIVLVLAIVVAAVKFAQSAHAADSNMQMFTSDDGALQLSVPTAGGWKSRSTEEGPFSLHLATQEGKNPRNIGITVVRRQDTGYATLKEAAQGTLEKSKGAEIFKITQELAPCKVTSGLECFYMEMERDLSGTQMGNLVAVVAGEHYFYFFVATAELKYYPKYKKDFLPILASLKETALAKKAPVDNAGKKIE